MFRRAALSVLLASLTIASCGESNRTTPPPSTLPPGDATITGNERVGWDQRASDNAELATFRYAIFVDGTRSELSGVSCDAEQAPAGFSCSAPLPRMSPGAHTLELATFIVEGSTLLESERSAALRVVVAGASTAGNTRRAPTGDRVLTADGVVLRVELVRADLDEPSDLAFAADGKLFVAGSSGTIQVARHASDAAVATTVPGPLLAIALDPAFIETRQLFALYVADDTGGRPAFTIARLRETDGRLSDRVVLLDSTAASAAPSGTLRFGPDHRLYAALDDGGVPYQADDLASANGKILRLEKDGTTPSDQDGLTPMFAHGLHAPHAMAWSPAARELWTADAPGPRDQLLLVSRTTSPKVRSVVRAAYRLPPPTTAAGMTFYTGSVIPQFEGNLFVASDGGEDLLRIRFDPADPTRVISTERLLRNQIGAMRAIAESPDGALYLATDTGLWRVGP